MHRFIASVLISLIFNIEQYQRSMDANVFSYIQILQGLIPLLQGKTNPSIVAISSKAVATGGRRIYPYVASKSAFASICTSLSKELAERGIRLNLVSPGKLVETVEHDTSYPGTTPATFEQVSNVIDFLLSDKAIGVIGQNIYLDGGR